MVERQVLDILFPDFYVGLFLNLHGSSLEGFKICVFSDLKVLDFMKDIFLFEFLYG
jgi:hypothetical protein